MATITISEEQSILKGTKRKLKNAAVRADKIDVQLVFPSENFHSVHLSQQSIKHNYHLLIAPSDETSKEWNEVGSLYKSIFTDPLLVIASNDNNVDDLEFIVGKTFEKVEASDSRYIHLCTDLSKSSSRFCRPYALIYVIETECKRGKPFLSSQDLSLLASSRYVKEASDSIVYVIQNTTQNQKYTSNDLMIVSNAIEEVLTLDTNSIYKHIFLETDIELSVRLGLIMQNHILSGMLSLKEMLSICKNPNKHSLRHPMQTRAAKKDANMQQNGKTRHVPLDPNIDRLTTLQNLLEDEVYEISNNVTLHAWKILSFRNSSIQAFGFVKGVVRIYLKDISLEADVMKYFKKFLKTSSLHVTMQVWPSNRQMTKYSYEQGSRVDVSNAALAENEETKYGTLGMFLENRKKELFFTTCAHVIEKGKYAFCPNDHSILGESVFACEGPSSNSKQWLDLSLVKVHNSKIQECRFGLKGDSGCSPLSEYKIFHGFLDDIRSRPVYKWGARTNYTAGTIDDYVISRDESDQKYFLEIRVLGSRKFALPADSGSLICMNYPSRIGNDPTAAFVIIGAEQIPVEDQKITMLCCYSVSDAIEEIRTSGTFGEGIQPRAVIRQSRRIASVSGCNPDLKTSVKRQKVLPPRE